MFSQKAFRQVWPDSSQIFQRCLPDQFSLEDQEIRSRWCDVDDFYYSLVSIREETLNVPTGQRHLTEEEIYSQLVEMELFLQEELYGHIEALAASGLQAQAAEMSMSVDDLYYMLTDVQDMLIQELRPCRIYSAREPDQVFRPQSVSRNYGPGTEKTCYTHGEVNAAIISSGYCGSRAGSTSDKPKRNIDVAEEGMHSGLDLIDVCIREIERPMQLVSRASCQQKGTVGFEQVKEDKPLDQEHRHVNGDTSFFADSEDMYASDTPKATRSELPGCLETKQAQEKHDHSSSCDRQYIFSIDKVCDDYGRNGTSDWDIFSPVTKSGLKMVTNTEELNRSVLYDAEADIAEINERNLEGLGQRDQTKQIEIPSIGGQDKGDKCASSSLNRGCLQESPFMWLHGCSGRKTEEICVCRGGHSFCHHSEEMSLRMSGSKIGGREAPLPWRDKLKIGSQNSRKHNTLLENLRSMSRCC